MLPSAYYDRVIRVIDDLFKFTLLLRGRTVYLTDLKRAQRKRPRQPTADRKTR